MPKQNARKPIGQNGGYMVEKKVLGICKQACVLPNKPSQNSKLTSCVPEKKFIDVHVRHGDANVS